MRKQYIENVSRYRAQKLMPWACAIVKYYNGYMGFESATDWRLWKTRK